MTDPHSNGHSFLLRVYLMDTDLDIQTGFGSSNRQRSKGITV